MLTKCIQNWFKIWAREMILNNPYFSQPPPPTPHKPNRILIYCKKTAPMTFFLIHVKHRPWGSLQFCIQPNPKRVPFSCFYIKP